MKSKLFLNLLLLTLLLTGCAQNVEKENVVDASLNSESRNVNEKPSHILTFEANTIDGEVLTSECFSQSKLTMLNIWATYCNPCLSEMPDIGEIAASYDETEFQVIGLISDVLEDAEEQDIEHAKNLIAETGANYPHLLLNQSLYSNLVAEVTSVPTTIFINQEGEMLGYVIGAQKKVAWEEIINELLEANE